MEVRANFESQLQQAEKKLEELSLGIEERHREAELLRVDLELETGRAKRDEMKLEQACRNAAENSDLLPRPRGGSSEVFCERDFFHDLWCHKLSAERFVYHIRTIFREGCPGQVRRGRAEHAEV